MTFLSSPFINIFDQCDYSFKTALETLKIQKNSILEQELWFLDPSSNNLKDLFNIATKEIFFWKIEQHWHKTCIGHEHKVADRKNRKWKAWNRAKKAESNYKRNPNILFNSVWIELRGNNDPFVHFKYVDNCNDCNCKSISERNVKKINIAEVLSKAEQNIVSEKISSEIFYATILNYLFQNAEES